MKTPKLVIATVIMGGTLAVMLGWSAASAASAANATVRPRIASTVDGYQAGYRDGLAVCGIR